MNVVNAFGWIGNLTSRCVMRLEIGRFRNRETKPSCGLLIQVGILVKIRLLAAYSRNFAGRAWQVKTSPDSDLDRNLCSRSEIRHAAPDRGNKDSRQPQIQISRDRFTVDAIGFVPLCSDGFEEAVDHVIVFERHAQLSGDATFDHCLFHHP